MATREIRVPRSPGIGAGPTVRVVPHGAGAIPHAFGSRRAPPIVTRRQRPCNSRETQRPYRPRMDVVVLRWPEEEERRTALRAVGRPRLLLLEDDSAPPVTIDPLEDWIRLPAGDGDVRARLAALEQRTPEDPRPEIDDHGV